MGNYKSVGNYIITPLTVQCWLQSVVSLNWEFNSNILMSIQGVPVSKSEWEFPKYTFHLIKSVAVTQTRTCRFSWIPGGLLTN